MSALTNSRRSLLGAALAVPAAAALPAPALSAADQVQQAADALAAAMARLHPDGEWYSKVSHEHGGWVIISSHIKRCAQ